jgi:hypothetical protein
MLSIIVPAPIHERQLVFPTTYICKDTTLTTAQPTHTCRQWVTARKAHASRSLGTTGRALGSKCGPGSGTIRAGCCGGRNSGGRGRRWLGARVFVNVLLGIATACARGRSIVRAAVVHPTGARGIRVVVVVVRVEDDVLAGIGLDTLAQAVHGAQAGRTAGPAVIVRSRIVADFGNGCRRLGCCACSSRRASTGACWLVIYLQVGARTARSAAQGLVIVFTRVEPTCTCENVLAVILCFFRRVLKDNYQNLLLGFLD